MRQKNKEKHNIQTGSESKHKRTQPNVTKVVDFCKCCWDSEANVIYWCMYED